jgi:hypothetical protein
LDTLQVQLRNIRTPEPVIQTIIQGFAHWILAKPGRSRAPTYGSLFGPDVVLTGAYYEQYYILGWYQLCLGHISKLWSQAVLSYNASKSILMDTEQWAIYFISLIWEFTRRMWTCRNQIIHGATVEETVNNRMLELHEKVTAMYNKYTEDPSFVLPRHEYLFTQRTLQYRLQMSYDSIICWIRSVEEPRNILDFQERNLRETAQTFFRLFRPPTVNSNSASDTESSYAPSSAATSTWFTPDNTDSTDSLTTWSSNGSLIDETSDSDSSCTTETQNVILIQIITPAPIVEFSVNSSSPMLFFFESDID